METTITYTVREVSVPKGYEARNDEDGKGNVVITNKACSKRNSKTTNSSKFI